ncbi:MAG TPA: hypothetical protein VGO47_00605 [Chlamydiales bacterium]|jgi:hypothetical protein|nr:hypothetical protein [Chlamydiales bacterium]
MSICARFAKCFSYILLFIYSILFIPALIYVSPLGLFILAVDGVGTVVAVSCLLTTVAIPLSMAASIYLTVKCPKNSLQMLFLACLPFLVAVFALCWAHLISWIYG